MTSGANRSEIANHFGLSAETVKRHTRNILVKFGAKTLREGMWDISDYLNNYGLPDPLYPLFAHKVIAEHVYDVDTRTMTVTHAHSFQCMTDRYEKTEIAVLEDDFVVNSVFIDGQEISPSGDEVGRKKYVLTYKKAKMQGDYFDRKYVVNFDTSEHLFKDTYSSAWTAFPAAYMEFSIHFQGHRVPDQLWSEVQQNSVKIIDKSVEIEKAQNFSKLIIRDPKPNRIYMFRWIW